LAALKTNVQVALGRLEHSPAQDELVAIDNGITRLNAVVDQLLIIARVDSLESAQLPRDSFNVHQLCSNVIGDVAQIAYEKQIELSLVADESLWISQHQALLEIALRNLLENAIKHARASQIEMMASQTGQQLILKVVDDGVGFADDILSNATERFSRGCSTQAEGVTGVGLGLAIVKRIAELINAKLTIENASERGASITLIIPL
jgi:signal transduction histidine kinase